MMEKNKTSFKNKKIRVAFITFISTLAWLVLWEISAHLLDLKFIFPGAIDTFNALGKLIVTADFWKTVLFSMLRIFLGLILGVVFGICFALLHQFIPFLRSFISIGMTIIKSTPVASIIMVLWVVMVNGSKNLPALIALLMVAPIIWQNLCDGFSTIDNNLSEVCYVFEFTRSKRIKLLILPQLIRYFVPAFLTSIGLAWKSGIAAEIISYTKNSIGKNIFDAKNYFEGDVMLAWTISVVILSLFFEYAVKYFLRRWKI